MAWSHGEVTKPETINYRTQRPEKDGLFSERIFGPTKDWECYCGKYKKVRYKGVVCDKCGVEVTRSVVRREWMGHISLATPVVHPWFLKSAPSKISLLLDESLSKLERVVYYAAHIIVSVEEEKRKEVLQEIKSELKRRKGEGGGGNYDEVKEETDKTVDLLESLRPGLVIDEADLSRLQKFSHAFTVSSGGEGIRQALINFNWTEEARRIEKEVESIREVTKRNKSLRRLAVIRSMLQSKIKPEWMVFTVLPILPPDLRPMVALDGGRYATSDLNDLYRRVINRNNRLKKLLELKAPSVIVVNEKRMLQEAVDALIDSSVHLTASRPAAPSRRPLRSLADMLKGKQGRFRQNLLGKRVDYSGRSVIVVGPHLKHDECGLPKKMALEIFRPFVIGQILDRGLAHNVKTANRLIEQEGPEVWEILEEVIADRKVLLNRAPTLHRLSVQAFKPILVEGSAIQIPPLVCTAFNADFDGDQMAVHLPLGREAQAEASQIMLSSQNFLSPASGESIVYPTQDVVLGCYYLTRVFEEAKGKGGVFADGREAKLAYENGYIEVGAPIKVGDLETTCGRIIFNEALPDDFGYINENLNRRKLQKLMSDLIYRYDHETIRRVIDDIKSLGFDYATGSGLSWGMDDLSIPKEKKAILEEADKADSLINEQYEMGFLTEEERRDKTIELWSQVIVKIGKVIPEALNKKSSVYMMIDSGARGSWQQPTQLMGMKGLVTNPKGDIIELPIKTSLKEGHSGLAYFITTHGSRKGLADTALKTAEAGYLTRRLIDVSQDVVIREKDCRTKEGIILYRGDGEDFGHQFSDRVFSRTALTEIKIGRKVVVKAGEIIDRKAAEEIQASDFKEIEVRSPIACKTLYGLCATCYGSDLGNNNLVRVGTAVGIIAAQSIGEPGTQLTLRTKHAGGVAGRDITTGLPRVEEIFEVHTPKGEAVLAPAHGHVSKIEESGHYKTLTLTVPKGKGTKQEEFSVLRDTALLVKEGDSVEAGDALTEGSLNLRSLLELKGKEATYRYIISEIQRIYVAEGNVINNKHLEIIVRQMFGRVRIVSAGDTEFTPGEIVDKSYFKEINKEMKAEDKEPARAEEILLGTTKSALAADGWLSAASFQETSRVLTSAATGGRIDYLRGLKENVIIGRLLPIGSQLEDDGRLIDQIERRREAYASAGEGEEAGE